MDDIKKEMEIVFKRIILRVAEKIEGMKVTEVEAFGSSRKLLQRLRERALENEVTMDFSVHIVRDDDKKFGPYIIQAIRDSYDEIISDIQ
jgi:hypothetical protein